MIRYYLINLFLETFIISNKLLISPPFRHHIFNISIMGRTTQLKKLFYLFRGDSFFSTGKYGLRDVFTNCFRLWVFFIHNPDRVSIFSVEDLALTFLPVFKSLLIRWLNVCCKTKFLEESAFDWQLHDWQLHNNNDWQVQTLTIGQLSFSTRNSPSLWFRTFSRK